MKTSDTTLNESFNFNELKGNTSSSNAFKVKRKEKSSLLDEIEQEIVPEVFTELEEIKAQQAAQQQFISDEIIVPETVLQKVAKKSLRAKALEMKKSDLQIRKDSVNNPKLQQIQKQKEQVAIEQHIQSEQEEIANELIQKYQEVNGDLPKDIDIIEVVSEIQDAADNIPDANNLEIEDFDIIELKPGVGWNKEKVTIKSEIASEELSKIATIVKKSTDNIVLHRAMDFRTIGNTNKTQLRSSQYKLYSASYNFRPKPGANIIAPKSTRIILSVSADYNSTKQVLIYIQESRSKFAIEINMDIEFIAKVIADYFIVGFETTKSRLKTNTKANPLAVVVNKFALTRKFLVKPLYDGDGEYDHVIITTKTGKHQWVKIHIKQLNISGTYGLYVKSKVDSDWKGFKINMTQNNKVFTIATLLEDAVIERIDKLFNDFDWASYGMGEDDVDNRDYYLINKLTYKPLKAAFVEIYDLSVSSPEDGVFVKEVLSQIDTAKDISSGYKAEVIIGKSNYIDYFILSWSAVQLKGGNNRVRKNENQFSTYHAREYMFTIVYSIGNKQYSMSAKTFKEITDATGFLTKHPKKL